MSGVGPSGSGKTRLISSMLTSKTFYFRFEKFYYIYGDFQLDFKEVEKKMNIEFINCLDFEMIKTLQDCLLIFDVSFEEIYQEKDFVRTSVSGIHKGIHCVFVKRNLFHQSRWSRTIDLNTTHNILFNSRRYSQQTQFFGKQLNKVNFLKECYTKAVPEPHGHLLIDLDSKTKECLRFC